MCYEDSARPPLPPVRGGSDNHGEVAIRSADGSEFDAYFAHPNVQTNKAVVIGPDVFGLRPFYKELAVRVAEAGYHAIAIDYYSRSAGRGNRDEGFAAMDNWYILAKTPETIDEDVAAASAWLRDLPGAGISTVFYVGFCLGGQAGFRQAATQIGLAGCVCFYPLPAPPIEFIARDRLNEISSPLLVFLGGGDWAGSKEMTEGILRDVETRGVEVEYHFYEGAPHGFFMNSDEFRPACDDAWGHLLNFMSTHN